MKGVCDACSSVTHTAVDYTGFCHYQSYNS